MKAEISSNIIANQKLDLIRKRLVFFIKENINKISEKDVSNFIVQEMKKEGMVLNPIHFVVVDENTDDSHWSKKSWKSKIVKKNSLIVIDYWAKIKGGKIFLLILLGYSILGIKFLKK